MSVSSLQNSATAAVFAEGHFNLANQRRKLWRQKTSQFANSKKMSIPFYLHFWHQNENHFVGCIIFFLHWNVAFVSFMSAFLFLNEECESNSSEWSFKVCPCFISALCKAPGAQRKKKDVLLSFHFYWMRTWRRTIGDAWVCCCCLLLIFFLSCSACGLRGGAADNNAPIVQVLWPSKCQGGSRGFAM